MLGTPLGCVGAKGASLGFLSSVDGPIPQRGSRVLISPFIAQAIDSQKRGLDALVLGYDRKIRLGRMDIRLLPSGFGPGSAQLEVSLKGQKIGLVSTLRFSQPLAAPSLVVPSCELLLIDVESAQPKPPAPKRVATRMLEWVTEVLEDGRTPVLSVPSRSAALEVAWVLRSGEMSVKASRPVFEMLRRVAPFGYAITKLRRFDGRVHSGDVVVRMASGTSPRDGNKSFDLGNAALAYAGPGRDIPTWAELGFRLGESEDRPGIVKFVKQTGASTVALGPRCDPEIGLALQKVGLEVYRVRRPSQTEFPF